MGESWENMGKYVKMVGKYGKIWENMENHHVFIGKSSIIKCRNGGEIMIEHVAGK